MGTSIEAKLRYVPTVEYHCGRCGRLLGCDEAREDLNPSKGKLYLYRWYWGRCPGCGARLTKPEVDDCVVGSFKYQMYGTRGGGDAGSC